MNWFLSYLRQRRLLILTFLLCCGTFGLTFWLYELPLAAVSYPTGLCALLLLGLAAFDIYRVWQKHLKLRSILEYPTDLSEKLFSEPVTMEDADYQQIILRLLQEKADLQGDLNTRYHNMVDYYTVWAHQIKTPIASMKLHLQGEDSSAARRLSADLLRTEQYVDMVMAFLRLESESSDYVIRQCDLDHIVRGAVRRFAGEFILRKLQLNYENLNATVLTDEKWLSFVVEQVLSNALKYTLSGSITITLEPEQVLCIRDTGIGIAPADLPRIFEKGYTGCNGRTSKQASGIGLFLCKQICTRLGHSICAQSQPEQGTVIRIDLSRKPLEIE